MSVETCVDDALFGMESGRVEMIEVEGSAHTSPLFSQKTEHAPIVEFVPEPRPIAPVIGVALRPMPLDVRRSRVHERHHLFRAASALASNSCCSRRASSSGIGATARRWR